MSVDGEGLAERVKVSTSSRSASFKPVVLGAASGALAAHDTHPPIQLLRVAELWHGS